MFVLKDAQGTVTNRYLYTSIRHVVEPENGSENILILLASKEEPNGPWNRTRIEFTQEDLDIFMNFNSGGTLSLKESVAYSVYQIAKFKGIIPMAANNE